MNESLKETTSVEDETPLDVLTFDGDVLKHVKLVADAPENVFKDFCRLALDFIHKGANEKRYNIAAEKLETTPLDISNAVRGMVYLMMNGCKHNLNEKEFHATLNEIGFSSLNKTTFVKFLNAKKEVIGRALQRFGVDAPTFYDLNWRLEAQVASRSHPDHVMPAVLLDLALVNYPTPSSKVADSPEKEPEKVITHKLLYCDLPNLDNLISNLEMALRETKFYQAKDIKTALSKEE